MPENNPPEFTSPSIGSIDENSPLTTVLYNADASDADGDSITYSLGLDADTSLRIDDDDGEVRLLISADYETKSSDNFDVIASTEKYQQIKM